MSISIVCRNKDPQPWLKALNDVDPSIEVSVFSENADRKYLETTEFVLSWRHPQGALQSFPNLKCICSMGAGVDHLLNDQKLPCDIPVVRLVDRQLSCSMFDYLYGRALDYFHYGDVYRQDQRNTVWRPLPPIAAHERQVGIMGLGEIGGYVAEKFVQKGYRVSGWSQSKKFLHGLSCYAGDDELPLFLAQSTLLICLLPLTHATKGVLNAQAFGAMPRGSALINVARGEHLQEQDLILALDSAQLRVVYLDVFQQEPLPMDHPFWQHPQVIITPHTSSITDPVSVAPQIIDNYRRMKAGKPLRNQVSMARGY